MELARSHRVGMEWPARLVVHDAGTAGSAIDGIALRTWNLRGKRIAVITDDSGRAAPASWVIPLRLGELLAAGA